LVNIFCCPIWRDAKQVKGQPYWLTLPVSAFSKILSANHALHEVVIQYFI